MEFIMVFNYNNGYVEIYKMRFIYLKIKRSFSMKIFISLVSTFIVLFTAQSYAAVLPAATGPTSGELKFNGTVSPSCNLMEFVDGTITATSDQTQLSSLNSGGSAASVSLRANTDGYTLPLGNAIVMGPDGEMSDVSITADAIGTGTDLAGVAVSNFGPSAADNTFYFTGGVYNFSVNATVTRLDGSTFKAGTYQLKIPVSCAASI
jgi:hypothetical protein